METLSDETKNLILETAKYVTQKWGSDKYIEEKLYLANRERFSFLLGNDNLNPLYKMALRDILADPNRLQGSASIIENPALWVAQQSNQMRASSSALHLAQNDRKKVQSPFQQANDRSQQILAEENAIKKGKGRKKDINEMKSNSQNGRSTSEIRVRGNENGGFDVRIDISEIIAMQKQKREMQKKRSQTPGVKQMTSQTKPGELRSETIKKLLQFDERDLDKFALPVTADIIRIPAGGKWTMLRPDGIIHLNQV
ncbi:MAG: hypothetical protein EZS28_003101, partial [Streblomastix strix]